MGSYDELLMSWLNNIKLLLVGELYIKKVCSANQDRNPTVYQKLHIKLDPSLNLKNIHIFIDCSSSISRTQDGARNPQICIPMERH